MGKPAVTMFVGVKIEDLDEEDLKKLPKHLQKELVEDNSDPDSMSVIVGNREFELVYEGCSDTADRGNVVGIGATFFSEHYDEGVVSCPLDEMGYEAKQLKKELDRLFKEWGLVIQPKICVVCHYA